MALVTSELNPADGGLDALGAVLEREDWGALPAPCGGLPGRGWRFCLDQVAEQAEEFARHGYRLVIVGAREGLDEALGRRSLDPLPQSSPATADELRAFLASVTA